MNKQEIAEWLAMNVLGLDGHIAGDYEGTPYYVRDKPTVLDIKQSEIVGFIYSPEGFFAVRAKLKECFGYGLRIEQNVVVGGRETCYISKHIDGLEFGGGGANEYEAFYNAVMEAMK